MYWGVENQTLLVIPLFLGGMIVCVLQLKFRPRFLPLLKGIIYAVLISGLHGLAVGVRGMLFFFHANLEQTNPRWWTVFLAQDPTQGIMGGSRALLYSMISSALLLVAYLLLRRGADKMSRAGGESPENDSKTGKQDPYLPPRHL